MVYPSAFLLATVNIIPVILVVANRWDAIDVLNAYWWLGLLLSLSTLTKLSIIRANATEKVRDEFDVMDLPVWAYVPVVVIGAIVTLWIFRVIGAESLNLFSGSAWQLSVSELVAGVFDPYVLWFVGLMAIRFGYSLYRNFYGQREFQRSRMLLERTVIRIFSLEAVAGILAAGAITTSFFPLWLATALIGLTDVLFHVVERAVGHKVDHPRQTDYGRMR